MGSKETKFHIFSRNPNIYYIELYRIRTKVKMLPQDRRKIERKWTREREALSREVVSLALTVQSEKLGFRATVLYSAFDKDLTATIGFSRFILSVGYDSRVLNDCGLGSVKFWTRPTLPAGLNQSDYLLIGSFVLVAQSKVKKNELDQLLKKVNKLIQKVRLKVNCNFQPLAIDLLLIYMLGIESKS